MRNRTRAKRAVACAAFQCDVHSANVDQSVRTSSLTPQMSRATSAAPMKRLIVMLALFGALLGFTPAWADDDDEGGGGHEAPAAEQHEAPAAAHDEQPAAS